MRKMFSFFKISFPKKSKRNNGITTEPKYMVYVVQNRSEFPSSYNHDLGEILVKIKIT
jgi:hypothetical protein